MQETLDFAAEFIRSYGFRAAAIVLATVLAVELIKIPIVRVAKTHAAKTGTDKSTVTRFVLLLPPVVAFALTLLMRLVETGFDVTAVDFSAVAADAVVYATMSVGVYESVKKQLEAYAAAKNVTSGDKNVEQTLENLTQETSEHITPGDKSGEEQSKTAPEANIDPIKTSIKENVFTGEDSLAKATFAGNADEIVPAGNNGNCAISTESSEGIFSTETGDAEIISTETGDEGIVSTGSNDEGIIFSANDK